MRREQEGKCESRISMLKSRVFPVSLEHNVKIDVRVWLFVDRKGKKEGLTKAITVACYLGPKGEKGALKEFIITDFHRLGGL